jgi:hypothetical protein
MSQSLSRQQNVAVEHVFGIDGSHSPSQNDECGISVDRAGNPPRRHTALHGLNFELGGQEPGGNQASRLQGKIKSSVDNRPSHSSRIGLRVSTVKTFAVEQLRSELAPTGVTALEASSGRLQTRTAAHFLESFSRKLN